MRCLRISTARCEIGQYLPQSVLTITLTGLAKKCTRDYVLRPGRATEPRASYWEKTLCLEPEVVFLDHCFRYRDIP